MSIANLHKMRNLFGLIALLFIALGSNAQFIYNDFDGNQNETFNGWPNDPELVANPEPSGINTSAGVGRWERSGEQWAHIYCLLDDKIDFETGTTFTLKAYSPIACEVVLKLEDKDNSGINTQVSKNITAVNQWVELLFDFPGGQSDTYDKIVVFFDINSSSSNTFYFDDVEGPAYEGAIAPKPLLALDVQDNFENDGWSTIDEWFYQDPDMSALPIVNDPANSGNHVAHFDRSGNFNYANAQCILNHRMDLSAVNTFELRVYFPSSNNYTGALNPTAAIKLQNSLLGSEAWTTQTEILHVVSAFDEWQTLTFDFSAIADRTDYDQVVVQLGGEGHNVPGQFYFDDLRLFEYIESYEQTIYLREGWSGLSSYVTPTNPNIEELLLAVVDDVEIVLASTGFYYPSQDINTLGNWDSHSGYAIKMNNASQLTIEGPGYADKNLTVPSGWSALPVLSDCEVSVEDIFGEFPSVNMIKDIAGAQVYWPEGEINSLDTLWPGEAYYISSDAEFSITYPECVEGYELVWSDEFDGSEVDLNNWTFETGAGGWGNNELQNYTDGDNSEIVDGKLVITARKVNDLTQPGSYTSSRMISEDKHEFQYGRLEIRAKLPSGTGIWPAIWMLGGNFREVGWPACGEIDIMEYVGYNPNVVHATVHTPSGSGGGGNGSSITVPTCEEEFHVYGLIWTEESMTFWVDTPENIIHVYAPEVKTPDNWPFDQTAFFILNVAVGGNWGGAQGIDNSIFPQSMEIDYVRVYQTENK